MKSLKPTFLCVSATPTESDHFFTKYNNNFCICTNKEQVTLQIKNCMGCPHFHKWKFKWKFFEVPRDFTCSLYSFFEWPVTCRWHVPSEITCENHNICNEFSLM